MKKAARENGYAAATREKRKRVKCNQERLPGESYPKFTPVVFEQNCRGGSMILQTSEHRLAEVYCDATVMKMTSPLTFPLMLYVQMLTQLL